MHSIKSIHVEDAISKLTGLGLTERQAKVYLHLAEYGCSNLTDISRLTGLGRGDVFRTMSSLLEKNLVFKVIGNPTTFEAAPIKDAIQMLLEAKEQELAQARKNASNLIEQLETRTTTTETSKGPRLLLVPAKQSWHFSVPMLNQAKTEICHYSTAKSLFYILNDPILRKPCISCAKRGVRNRYIIDKTETDILKINCFRNFIKQSSVEIRYTSQPVIVNLFLSDHEQALFTSVAGTNVGEQPNIWTNNLCIVEMAQDFFEKRWKDTIPAITK